MYNLQSHLRDSPSLPPLLSLSLSFSAQILSYSILSHCTISFDKLLSIVPILFSRFNVDEQDDILILIAMKFANSLEIVSLSNFVSVAKGVAFQRYR